MAKIKTPAVKGSSSGSARVFAGLSEAMFKELMMTIREFAKAGASNFMMGYYASNWANDFQHSAFLITDQCYQDNRLWGDILAGDSVAGDIIGSILGNGQLAPTLRTRVETYNEGGRAVTETTTGPATQGLTSDVDAAVN